jgi:hypothetical protein
MSLRAMFTIGPVVLVFAGCSSAPTTPQSQRISNEHELAAALIRRDAQMKSVELTVQLDIGGAKGGPKATMSSVYLKSGANECLTTDGAGGFHDTYSTDGKTVRYLMTPAEGSPSAQIMPAGPHPSPYGVGNRLDQPHGYTGQFIDSFELIPALEAGDVRLLPALADEDGHACLELRGNAPLKNIVGMKEIRIRVLLDPACSLMPRRVEVENHYAGGLTSKAVLDQYELSEVAPGVWYPTKLRQQALKRSTNDWINITTNLLRVRVESYNQPIPASRFLLPFPKGTKVTDVVAGRSFVEPLRYIEGETSPADQKK